MRSRLALALLLILGACSGAAGQEWANKMFKTTRHDFGQVARGAKAEFAFELENIYEEEVRIASVRSTCGCAAPSATKSVLKTWEKGAVVAAIDTAAHRGPKTATIVVTLDRPFPAEVRLEVVVDIRADVTFTPGVVQFGDVDAGEPAERTIHVSHAGRGGWQIVDVRSANSHFEVSLQEARRTASQVGYNMLVRLKESAPPGYLRDELTIVTNDPQARSVPLMVEGRVVSPLSVSPASLVLGVLKPGEKVTKQILVKGKRPFRITRVSCSHEGFAFNVSDEAKKVHLTPVTFTAPSTPGKVAERIEVETDAGVAALTAVATVVGE